MLPDGALHVTAAVRITAGINKAEYVERNDTQIKFTDALRRIFPTVLARHLQFRRWIRQEILCHRISVTYLSEATGRQD